MQTFRVSLEEVDTQGDTQSLSRWTVNSVDGVAVPWPTVNRFSTRIISPGKSIELYETSSDTIRGKLGTLERNF